jgi:hypothetical protein
LDTHRHRLVMPSEACMRVCRLDHQNCAARRTAVVVPFCSSIILGIIVKATRAMLV